MTDHQTICFCVPGVVTPNLLDQLETASFMGGFHASIRGSAPACSHYVSTGLEPFVAVYSAIEVCYLVARKSPWWSENTEKMSGVDFDGASQCKVE